MRVYTLGIGKAYTKGKTMITQTTSTDNGLNTIIFASEHATLSVEATTGLILSIDVPAEHRGEGHARAIYEHAETIMDIYHVPSWGRTEDGDAFAEAMGGDTMDDQEAADTLGLDLETVAPWLFDYS